VRGHPEHELAPDSQYKLGQCYEQAGQLDEALESYVTLAATYPKSPLIANVMLRINEHFYGKEDYAVAASVGSKFLERFPNHEWTPKMGFRIGQCYYKDESFENAGDAFDTFVKRFPEEELTAQALFWAGESYRMDNDVPNAFRRYNRCRWDFPESDAAKYSRGRLALPEMLAQFEREANLSDE
jgi:TolA-binding protein